MSAQSGIFNPSQTTSAATGEGFSCPRLSTGGRLAIAFGPNDKGMMVYDVTLNNLFIWNGAAWESVPASGDAGADGAVQFNDNGVVSGAANFYWSKVQQKVGIGTNSPNVELDVVGNSSITGDLTVKTNVLKVDTTNNRVGVLTASPINTLHVNGEVTLPINNLQYWNAYYSGGFKSVAAGYAGYTAFATNGDFVLANTDTSAAGAASALTFYNRYRISNAGIHTWETVGGVAGTAMTLNATGLGVGRTPISKLTVDKASQTPGGTTPNGALVITDTVGSNLALEFGVNSAALPWIQSRNSTTNTYYDLLLNPNGGNLGIGVAPSGTIYSVSETRLVVKGTSNNFAGTLAVQSKGTTNAVTGFLTASDNTNEVAVGSTTNSPLNFYTNNALKATIDASGNLILLSSATPATLTTNGQLTVNATSNTNLRFSYRGSDGVTRVANITLA